METKVNFVPLHVHSEYSSLDGAIMISDYVQWACKHNLPAVSITDHGVMASAVPLKKACDAAGIKPIMGCELYAEPFVLDGNTQENFHLLALPLTHKGFKALIRLLSMGYKDNFHKKPRVSLAMLEELGSEDIFFSTACMQGELSQLLLRRDKEGAVRFVTTMKSLLKDNFAIELIDTGPQAMVSPSLSQYELNKILYDLAKSQNVQVIMTTDSHYFVRDMPYYKALLATQMKTTQQEIEDRQEWELDLSLRTPDEMWERWKNNYADALLNTVKIAEQVENFAIALDKPLLPKLQLNISLEDLARQKLEQKLAYIPQREREEYRARLEKELSVISQMGYNDYFLMVWDAVNWARQQGIFVGPGRGSAAGSLLSYALGITQVDPIQHGLIFERFLNPERVNMPDIDLDFEDSRRDDIIQYLKRQYGENAVVPIANYIRMHLRAALRDAMRALGYEVGPHSIGDSFARHVAASVEEEGGEYEYATLLEAAQDFEHFTHEEKEQILKLTTTLSNRIRNYSKHACGVVIAPPDVVEYAPLYRLNNEIICQYNMESIDYMNLVKMDILGLSTLTVLKKTYESALQFDNKTPSPDDIYIFLNYEDRGYVPKNLPLTTIERAYGLLQEGDTTGVFQMFSPGMRRLLRSLRPKNIEDLSVLVALYRPGPLSSNITNTFVNNRKCGSKDQLFPAEINKIIEPITADADGLPIYQEHVMRIAQEVAGYSLGEADLLRRAMGKKKADLMQSIMTTFVEKTVQQGHSEEDARQTFDILQHFAGYGFNKSHSMAYAYLAFATAWYKANRSAVFWAAFLNTKKKQVKREDIAPFIREARAWHSVIYPILLPGENGQEAMTIRAIRNAGGFDISVDEAWRSNQCWQIILGLDFIKGVAGAKLDGLKQLSGNISSLEDLVFFLVTDPEGKQMQEKHVATVLMAGFFDYLFKEYYRNNGISPMAFRIACLINNDTTAMPHKLASALVRALGIFKKNVVDSEDWVRKTLLQIDRDFFTAFFSFVVSKLRSRMKLKRSWDINRIQAYIEEPFRDVVQAIFEQAQDLMKQAQEDEKFKIHLQSLLHEHEKTLFGEGVVVTRDMFYHKYIDIWAEEFANYKRQSVNGLHDNTMPLRIGGFVTNIYRKPESCFLVLEGRYGNKFSPIFLPIAEDQYAQYKEYIGKMVVVEGHFVRTGTWVTSSVKLASSYVLPVCSMSETSVC